MTDRNGAEEPKQQGNPAGGTPPDTGQQSSTPWAQYHQQQKGASSPKRKFPLWAMIGIPVVFVFLLISVIGGGFLIFKLFPFTEKGEQGNLGTGEVSDPAQYFIYWPAGPVKEYATDISGLGQGSDISPDTLANVDPRQLYWAMLKRQSMQNVTDYVSTHFQSPREYQAEYPGSRILRVAIDYQAGKFISDSADLQEDGTLKLEGLSRCIDGKYAVYRNGQWSEITESMPGFSEACAKRLKPREITHNSMTSDGIATGGLTSEEADKFISYLDGIPGLFTMEKPQPVQGKDGKTYIQLDVRISQQDSKFEGVETAIGAGFLNAAFAQTGKHPYEYPYSIDIGPGQGRQMRYYIDPETLLPAYSVMMSLPPVKLDGTIANDLPQSYDVFQYSFPDQLDPQAMQADGPPKSPYREFPFEQVFFQEGEGS